MSSSPPAARDAGVARGAEPAVGLAHEHEARVLLRDPRRDRRGAVGRAVVDHHDLEVGERLRAQRREALLQVGLDAVDRHDDADPRHRPYRGRPRGPRRPQPPRRASRRRRRLLGAPAIALHRAALALVRRLPPARDAAGHPRAIRILLHNAYALGGTVRTTMNLAGELALRHEVEIVSVRRHAARPFFPHPARVTVSVLDDRTRPPPRSSASCGASRAC